MKKMQKYLKIIVLFLITFVLFSCNHVNYFSGNDDNESNNNENNDIDGENKSDKLYVDYVKLRVTKKNLDYCDENNNALYILEVAIDYNYNNLLNIETPYSKYIDELVSNNNTLLLNTSKEFFENINLDNVFIYKLYDKVKIIHKETDKSEYVFSTRNNEYTILLIENGKIIFRFLNDSIPYSINTEKSLMCYKYIYCNKLFVDIVKSYDVPLVFEYNNQTDVNAEYLFKLTLLKHQEIDKGMPRWGKYLYGDNIIITNNLEDDLASLNQFNIYNDSDNYIEIDETKYYDDFYLYVVLSSEATTNGKEYSLEKFQEEYLPNTIFSKKVTSIEELNYDKYLKIQKRLNGELVEDEIMNLDLDTYHRVLIVKFIDNYYETKEHEINQIKTELDQFKDILFVCNNYLSFTEREEQIVNYHNFVKLHNESLLLKNDNNVLIKCKVTEIYDKYLGFDKNYGGFINIMIPQYIYSYYGNDFEYLYQLTNAKETIIDNKTIIYYDVEDNLKTFYPLYNDRFFIIQDKANNSLYEAWANSCSNFYFVKLNEQAVYSSGFTDYLVSLLARRDNSNYFKNLIILLDYENKHNVYLHRQSDKLFRYLCMNSDYVWDYGYTINE